MNLPSDKSIRAKLLEHSADETKRLDTMHEELLAQLPVQPNSTRLPFPLEWLKTHKVYTTAIAACWALGFFFNLNTPKPYHCLLYTSPSPRDGATSRMPSSA